MHTAVKGANLPCQLAYFNGLRRILLITEGMEFRSKPLTPHPLFADFVRASHAHKVAAQSPTAEAVT